MIAFATAFTWPALVAFGFLAIVFPRPRQSLPVTTGRWHRGVALATAGIAGACIVAWFLYVIANPAGVERWLDRAHHDLYPLTIAIIVLQTAIAAYIVARQSQTWSVMAYLRAVGWRRIIVGAFAVLTIVFVREVWHAHVATSDGIGLRDLRDYYVANALLGPLWSFVHQVVYFGPIVIVAYAAWPRIAVTAASWGPTTVLALAICVISAISSDARHLLHVMPYIIVIAVSATADWWSPKRAIGFALIYLPWSKLWLEIGYDAVNDSRAWPDLRFFMHHGPWATDETFLAHLAAAAVTALALWRVLRARDVRRS